jgi:hypothetical protein
MKHSRFFVTLLLISGLFFLVSSSAMAKTRYTLEKESIKNVIKQDRYGMGLTSDGYTEIVSKVKLRNSSNKTTTFDIVVTFVNAEKDTLGEATKSCQIQAGESKIVSAQVLLDSKVADQIDSGYVTISDSEEAIEVETHSKTATMGDNLKENIAFSSDRYIKVDYNVKLRNKSDKPVTSDLTIAFLDKDNVKVGEARTTGFFDAGELKTISDTVVLRTSDASRIATSRVTIEKM